MTCKCLITETRLVSLPLEVGGNESQIPVTVHVCKLGRKPVIMHMIWAQKCQETLPQGPCWFWIEENGNIPDVELEKCK